MSTKKSQFSHLFWFLDKRNPDLKKDKNLVVHQVLSYGTMDDIRNLVKFYGKTAIKKEFVKPRPGLYYPSVLEFCRRFLGVKKINKKEYLKNVYGAASRNIR